MARYRSKPEIVDARQFIGGKDSALMLNQWLTTHGYTTEWVEERTMVGVTLPELIHVRKNANAPSAATAYSGWWLVRYSDNSIEALRDAEFKERFEQV